MVKSPKKNITPKSSRPAPGKTVLPRQKFQPKQSFNQRRFSIIDSDSSSLSDYESDENDDDEDSNEQITLQEVQSFNKVSGEFQAIESESDEDDEIEEEEHLWKTNASKVVNTSSEDEDDEDDNSSSSDDENVDLVKLTAERKRAMLSYRSASPFASKSKVDASKSSKSQQDVDFSFDFNNNDHQLKIEEEEDVGEELSHFSPVKDNINIPPISNEPLGFMNIEESSESDGEINRDELLKTLEQDSDDGLDTGIETGDDEMAMLKHEAEMIAQEYDEDGLQLSSTNATPRNSVVENLIKQHKSEMQNNEVLQFVSDDEYDSFDEDDDEDDFDQDDAFMIPFFDDSVFKEELYQQNKDHIRNKHGNDDQFDSEDDSYLWDYFFSSGEEDNDDNSNNNSNNNSNSYSDDETTDEDTSLPPPSSRNKFGSKAQELLSSSSVAVRPPALGTWSTDSKPFGIIDGLSTRSLLPNNSSSKAATSVNSTGLNGAALSKSVAVRNDNDNELAIDELLNMSELEDEDDGDMNHELWLEVMNSNRNVPLSAFRNKGVIDNHNAHINATRRFSTSQGGNGVSKLGRIRSVNPDASSSITEKRKNQKLRFNDQSITPLRSSVPKLKQKKIKSSKMRRRQSSTEAAVEGLRVTKSGLFSEDTLNNVEEFLSGLGAETELSVLFREVQ